MKIIRRSQRSAHGEGASPLFPFTMNLALAGTTLGMRDRRPRHSNWLLTIAALAYLHDEESAHDDYAGRVRRSTMRGGTKRWKLIRISSPYIRFELYFLLFQLFEKCTFSLMTTQGLCINSLISFLGSYQQSLVETCFKWNTWTLM